MPTKAERLERVRTFRGCDWFPTWARSPVDYWTATCPRDVAARELGFAAGLGFDHVRIWLSAWGYELDPTAYLANLAFLLDTADNYGLGVVMELFDSCGIEPSTGRATTVRIEDIPTLAAGDPRLGIVSALSGKARDVFGGPGLVEVPWRGDPIVAVWEGFAPNPGYDFLAPDHWPRWDTYARAVVEAVRDHPAMVVLELMNEPFVTHIGQDVDRQPIIDFYRHVHDVVRPLADELPLTIGAATTAFFADHEVNLGCELDLVSFHSLSGPDAMSTAIAHAKTIAGERPVYLSEWGYFPGGDDAEQRHEYERLLPVLAEADIGWAVSHLIAGYGPFGNTAVLYPSGVMRPAAQLVRHHLEQRVPAAGAMQ